MKKPSDIDRDDYGTPKCILDPARELLHGIDLDPFSSAWHNRRVKAQRYYDGGSNGDGIAFPWYLFEDFATTVWCNPPYSRGLIGPCVNRWIHAAECHWMLAGLILVNATTSSGWCQAVMEYPHVMLRKRLAFYHPATGDKPQHGNRHAQMIAYAGPRYPEFRRLFGPMGVLR